MGVCDPLSKKLIKKFKTNFSERHLRKKAYESGFFKRLSKFSPLMFFDSLLYDSTRLARIYNPCLSLLSFPNEICE